MEYQDIFAKALQQATSIIRLVSTDQLTNSTPCQEWDLRTLINHMVYELLWAPEIIKSKDLKEVGNRFDGDLLGSDPQFSWKHAADAALVAVHSSNPKAKVQLSYGRVALPRYITELAADLLIHGWDVGKSIGCTVLFNSDLTQAVYKFSRAHAREMASSQLFGKPLTVAPTEGLQTKLLGLYGRRAAWVTA